MRRSGPAQGLPYPVTLWVWVWTARAGLSCWQASLSTMLSFPSALQRPVCPPSRAEEGVCAGNQSCCPTCLRCPTPWQGLLVTVNGNPVDYHTIHPSLPLENGPAKAGPVLHTTVPLGSPPTASPGKKPVGLQPAELSISCLWFILHRMWFSFLSSLEEVFSFHSQSDEAHFLRFCLDFAPISCPVHSVLGTK